MNARTDDVPGDGRSACTRTLDDIHATLFTEKYGWKQIVQKAVITDENGKRLVTSSMKYLNERKKEDRVAFAYQYLNTAVKSSEVGISPDLIIKSVIPEDYDCLGVGIDLSAGLKEKNDWTVLPWAG